MLLCCSNQHGTNLQLNPKLVSAISVALISFRQTTGILQQLLWNYHLIHHQNSHWEGNGLNLHF